MSHEKHHEHLIKELSEQLEPLFTNSPQAIYLYLDDTHKTCNQKFADMLGYASTEEWVANEYSIEDVIEEERDNVIEAYVQASQNFTASTFSTQWIRKDNKKLKTEVTVVPITYRDEVFVLHFISTKK